MFLVLLTLILSSPNFPWIDVGLATIYWPGDGHCGEERADGKPFQATDHHIAHRTLPLGSRVMVCTFPQLRCTQTRVRDRGTYGFCKHDSLRPPNCEPLLAPDQRRKCPERYTWVVRTRAPKNECGFYRGIADVTRGVAADIGLQGMQMIVIILVDPKRTSIRQTTSQESL